jgi:hypothetical protein
VNSRSEMRRLAVQKPDALIQEIERLRAENARLEQLCDFGPYNSRIARPEGIGFTAEDFGYSHEDMLCPSDAADRANAKLPALFEAWVKREGLPVGHRCRSKYVCYHEKGFGLWCKPKSGDTLAGYVVLIERVEKRQSAAARGAGKAKQA